MITMVLYHKSFFIPHGLIYFHTCFDSQDNRWWLDWCREWIVQVDLFKWINHRFGMCLTNVNVHNYFWILSRSHSFQNHFNLFDLVHSFFGNLACFLSVLRNFSPILDVRDFMANIFEIWSQGATSFWVESWVVVRIRIGRQHFIGGQVSILIVSLSILNCLVDHI